MTPADLQKQIDAARLDVARNALAVPRLYPEYQRMIRLEGELEEARLRYVAAVREWVALTAPANQQQLEGV